MISRLAVALLLLSNSISGYASECEVLQPGSEAYQYANQAMSGHFPVELSEILRCGLVFRSRLFEASVAPYENHAGWVKSGSLKCWLLSQHVAGEPFDCSRTITSNQGGTGLSITSDYEIPLSVIDEATQALLQVLTEADEVIEMDYVPVKCGGAWSVEEHGYLYKLKPQTPGVQRQFVAKKNCSPAPCLWVVLEVEPIRTSH